jgi:hypothetical protein
VLIVPELIVPVLMVPVLPLMSLLSSPGQGVC